MKNSGLDSLTTAQLVERFAALGIEEDKAVFDDDNAKYNRLYGQMDAIKEELKRRPGDQRRALLPLFDHPNIWVRLMAAKGTLAVAPDASAANEWTRLAGLLRKHAQQARHVRRWLPSWTQRAVPGDSKS